MNENKIKQVENNLVIPLDIKKKALDIAVNSNYQKLEEARSLFRQSIENTEFILNGLNNEKDTNNKLINKIQEIIMNLWIYYAEIEIELRQYRQATKVYEDALISSIYGLSKSTKLWISYANFCINRKKHNNAKKIYIRALMAISSSNNIINNNNNKDKDNNINIIWNEFHKFVAEQIDPNVSLEDLKKTIPALTKSNMDMTKETNNNIENNNDIEMTQEIKDEEQDNDENEICSDDDERPVFPEDNKTNLINEQKNLKISSPKNQKEKETIKETVKEIIKETVKEKEKVIVKQKENMTSPVLRIKDDKVKKVETTPIKNHAVNEEQISTSLVVVSNKKRKNSDIKNEPDDKPSTVSEDKDKKDPSELTPAILASILREEKKKKEGLLGNKNKNEIDESLDTSINVALSYDKLSEKSAGFNKYYNKFFFEQIPSEFPVDLIFTSVPHLLFDILNNKEKDKLKKNYENYNNVLTELPNILSKENDIFTIIRKLATLQYSAELDNLFRFQDLIASQVDQGILLYQKHLNELKGDEINKESTEEIKTKQFKEYKEFCENCKKEQHDYLMRVGQKRHRMLANQQITLKKLNIPYMEETTDSEKIMPQRGMIEVILEIDRINNPQKDKKPIVYERKISQSDYKNRNTNSTNNNNSNYYPARKHQRRSDEVQRSYNNKRYTDQDHDKKRYSTNEYVALTSYTNYPINHSNYPRGYTNQQVNYIPYNNTTSYVPTGYDNTIPISYHSTVNNNTTNPMMTQQGYISNTNSTYSNNINDANMYQQSNTSSTTDYTNTTTSKNIYNSNNTNNIYVDPMEEQLRLQRQLQQQMLINTNHPTTSNSGSSNIDPFQQQSALASSLLAAISYNGSNTNASLQQNNSTYTNTSTSSTNNTTTPSYFNNNVRR